jgi:replicative DNA helicase
MNSDKNFNYLGETFQLQLLNQIVLDKNFARSIVDVIEVNYFENKYFKIILQMIKEYHREYETSPSFLTLEQITKSEIKQEFALNIVLDTIKKVKDIEIDGTDFVQRKALKFCKQQELQKVMDKAQKIIDNGEFENYDTLEEMIRGALSVGEVQNTTESVFSDLDDVLNEDFRNPIPVGIESIDKLMKGGLAKGEIGVILAPTGVGKSTILTKFANHAFNLGYNVLQIFFEDNPKIIKRKHFTLWTGIRPDDLSVRKPEVLSKVREIENNFTNKLHLVKYPSDTMTMFQIKNEIRKLIADGNQIDMVLLDYIDCVLPEQIYQEDWKSEGTVIRKFEAMCHELDIAGWTATQGNRSSISSEVVNHDQMGGSIKKAQVGHIIISIAKTLQQKDMKLATIAITKSRIGPDGVVFENCKFDNEMLEIDTESSTTLLGFEEQKVEEKKNRIAELMEKRKLREQQNK